MLCASLLIHLPTSILAHYNAQVVANCRALGRALAAHGYKLVTDGTDNHLVLWDLRPNGTPCANANYNRRIKSWFFESRRSSRKHVNYFLHSNYAHPRCPTYGYNMIKHNHWVWPSSDFNFDCL